MRVLMVFFLVTVLLTPSSYAQRRLSDKEIIQAFLACPEIINAQKELAKGAEPGAPRVILNNSGCGAAGCQYTALVAQPFERRRADPFVHHLLGYVHVGPKGNITLIERVELVPIKATEVPDKTDEER
jgi:hypothetical protein